MLTSSPYLHLAQSSTNTLGVCRLPSSLFCQLRVMVVSSASSHTLDMHTVCTHRLQVGRLNEEEVVLQWRTVKPSSVMDGLEELTSALIYKGEGVYRTPGARSG